MGKLYIRAAVLTGWKLAYSSDDIGNPQYTWMELCGDSRLVPR